MKSWICQSPLCLTQRDLNTGLERLLAERRICKRAIRLPFRPESARENKTGVSVSYKGLANDLKPGDRILVNNGLLIFEVTSIEKGDVVCQVLAGGEISDRKSMSFPNKVLKQST